MKSQKYILDSDDLVKSSFVTSGNKTAFLDGGLFDDLILKGGSEISSNFTTRKLFNAAGEESVDWNTMRLTGSTWTVTGDLIVDGSVKGDVDLSSSTISGITTDDVVEGSSNQYYTDEKVEDRVGAIISPTYPITVEYQDNGTNAGSVNIGFDGVKGQVTTTTTIHVNPAGTNDRSASVSKYDIADPYKTIKAAQDAAASGDTIVVWPGTYSNESELLKDGVSFYFHPGAHVSNTGASQSACMFADCESMTSSVYGYGKFSTSEENYPLLNIGHPGSKIYFQGLLIESTFTAKPAVYNISGDLRLDVQKLYSAGDVVRIGAGTTIVENGYLRSSGNGSGVNVVGATAAGVFITNCQIQSDSTSTADGAVYVETGSSTTRLKNTLLYSESTSSVTSSAGSSAQVSMLGGVCANKDSHADVSLTELAPFTFDEDMILTII